jgi:hypothetical protein
MYIDPNKYPAGMLVNDPNRVINAQPTPYGTLTNNSSYNTTAYDPISDMSAEIKNLKTTQKLMLLRILHLEGRFDKEEVSNLRKMIMSEDQASRTLAESIIENA